MNTAERRLHAGAVMERASEKDNKRSLKSSLMQCEIKESRKRERAYKYICRALVTWIFAFIMELMMLMGE